MRRGSAHPEAKPKQQNDTNEEGPSPPVNRARHPVAPCLFWHFPWRSGSCFRCLAHALSRILIAMGRGHVVATRQRPYCSKSNCNCPSSELPGVLERGKKVIVRIESILASTDRLTKGQYRVNRRT